MEMSTKKACWRKQNFIITQLKEGIDLYGSKANLKLDEELVEQG
jgi:hypothetical protein